MIYWIIAYAVTVVIAYAVIRLLLDGDEDEILSVIIFDWVMSLIWPATLVGFSVIALIAFVIRQFDHLLFRIRDGVAEKIEASRTRRQEGDDETK